MAKNQRSDMFMISLLRHRSLKHLKVYVIDAILIHMINFIPSLSKLTSLSLCYHNDYCLESLIKMVNTSHKLHKLYIKTKNSEISGYDFLRQFLEGINKQVAFLEYLEYKMSRNKLLTSTERESIAELASKLCKNIH